MANISELSTTQGFTSLNCLSWAVCSTCFLLFFLDLMELWYPLRNCSGFVRYDFVFFFFPVLETSIIAEALENLPINRDKIFSRNSEIKNKNNKIKI